MVQTASLGNLAPHTFFSQSVTLVCATKRQLSLWQIQCSFPFFTGCVTKTWDKVLSFLIERSILSHELAELEQQHSRSGHYIHFINEESETQKEKLPPPGVLKFQPTRITDGWALNPGEGPDSEGQGWRLRICISNIFPGHAGWPHFKNHWLRVISLLSTAARIWSRFGWPHNPFPSHWPLVPLQTWWFSTSTVPSNH